MLACRTIRFYIHTFTIGLRLSVFIAHKIVFLLSRGRVVVIVTRLWDRGFVVRISAGARDLFLLHNIHTVSEVQLA